MLQYIRRKIEELKPKPTLCVQGGVNEISYPL